MRRQAIEIAPKLCGQTGRAALSSFRGPTLRQVRGQPQLPVAAGQPVSERVRGQPDPDDHPGAVLDPVQKREDHRRGAKHRQHLLHQPVVCSVRAAGPVCRLPQRSLFQKPLADRRQCHQVDRRRRHGVEHGFRPGMAGGGIFYCWHRRVRLFPGQIRHPPGNPPRRAPRQSQRPDGTSHPRRHPDGEHRRRHRLRPTAARRLLFDHRPALRAFPGFEPVHVPHALVSRGAFAGQRRAVFPQSGGPFFQ